MVTGAVGDDDATTIAAGERGERPLEKECDAIR